MNASARHDPMTPTAADAEHAREVDAAVAQLQPRTLAEAHAALAEADARRPCGEDEAD